MCSFPRAFQRYQASGELVGLSPRFVDPKIVISVVNLPPLFRATLPYKNGPAVVRRPSPQREAVPRCTGRTHKGVERTVAPPRPRSFARAVTYLSPSAGRNA